MYLKMFGFSEKPFHITPNPRFIFLSKIHKEAFAHLLFGIQQRVGFMSLSGEIGTGKTTVLRTLLDQLADAEYRVALIFNPGLTSLELLQTIHREFSIPFDPGSSNLVQLHDSLNQFLLQQREAGRTVVLVVDEAQNLDPQVLEQLRLLSNLETETEKLIQMVLVGQPELDELLQRKDLRQLRQRLAVSYHLQPMDAEDTRRYVLHRAAVAGNSDHSLFSLSALKQIYLYTRGTPRLINLLCDRALLVAYSRDARTVARQDVRTAQAELRQQKSVPSNRWRPVVGLLAVCLLLAVGVKLFQLARPVVQSPAAEEISVIEPPPKVPIEPAAAPIEPVAVTKEPASVPVAPRVTEARIVELINQVDSFSTEASGQQSVVAIAEAWGLPVPAQLPLINGRRQMKAALQQSGFAVVEINGQSDELLKIDSPVVLELTLPNVTGKRFLVVTRYRDGKLQTDPPLSESGWLELAELEAIWFGKALLPYINFQSIPLIDQPESAGQAVTAVQRLLATQEDDLVISNVYDRQTIAAVTDFQRRMRLAPDGRVGAHTLFWLYRQAGEKMPRLAGEDGS